MSKIPTFEPTNTVMMTWQSSVAPDAAPIFKVIDDNKTVLSCVTAIQSTSTAYYALYTMQNTDQPLVAEWFAQKTVSGSARNFIKRFPFRILETIVG